MCNFRALETQKLPLVSPLRFFYIVYRFAFSACLNIRHTSGSNKKYCVVSFGNSWIRSLQCKNLPVGLHEPVCLGSGLFIMHISFKFVLCECRHKELLTLFYVMKVLCVNTNFLVDT